MLSNIIALIHSIEKSYFKVVGIVINQIDYRNLWINGEIPKNKSLEEVLKSHCQIQEGDFEVHITNKLSENEGKSKIQLVTEHRIN